MTAIALAQIALLVGLLAALGMPLGAYMARVYSGDARFAQRLIGPVERVVYRLAGVAPDEEMSWQQYARALLVFNLMGMLLLFALQRLQSILPGNPAHVGPVPAAVAFNTAVSFVSNTNWQAYAGETTLSHLTQMAGLTVQNFLSAATGMAVLVALTRGIARHQASGLGSFWVDLTRTTLYVLLPLSFVIALLLVSQGVVQTLQAQVTTATGQVIALGPAASQVAIKQLGTNGGGFFNANSAHPFENPTALSNLLELLSILLIPAALCSTFGTLVKDRRQGWALLSAMLVILVPLLVLTVVAEQAGNPLLTRMGVDQAASALLPGGNMEGKEARFGASGSAIWAVATTAASSGSVNAMHDSFTPLGGLAPMWLMQLGEVVFGGVGSGVYGMLVYAIVAVFMAGLMVGRTPEYLGKKVETFEMKMASLVILIPAAAVLCATAAACVLPAGTRAVLNPGPHGFSEILYAFSSAANNNGSAFAGIDAASPFYAVATALCMLAGRYLVIVPVIALAGSLAGKKLIPASAGTLPTHTPLFVALLVGTVLLLGALTFIPSLALGPVVEHLMLAAR